jgi:hypothetical protein
VIHDKVDGVMRAVMRELRLKVPVYERIDALDLLLEMPSSTAEIPSSATEVQSLTGEVPISTALGTVGAATAAGVNGASVGAAAAGSVNGALVGAAGSVNGALVGAAGSVNGALVGAAGSVNGALAVRLRSVHGEGCPIPWLRQCTVRFTHAAPGTPPVVLTPPVWRAHLPLPGLQLPPSGIASAVLGLEFEAGATEPRAEVQCDVPLGPAGTGGGPHAQPGTGTDIRGGLAQPGVGLDADGGHAPAMYDTGGGHVRHGCHRVEVVTCHVEYEEAPAIEGSTQEGAEAAPGARKRARNK